jgi:serine/threonine-protein kinase
MLGETVGKYRIVRKIGEGGMGVVYLAEHALIGRRAAVKVLLPAYSHDVHVVSRFFNEARAIAGIKHPGLVDIYDFGTLDDGSAFLVMEWLSGESLAERVQRKGRLRPNFAVEIGRQLAGAMAAAHTQQIVHRDLKPDNVYLVADADLPFATRVKVLDFGVAKVFGMPAGAPRTHSQAVLGTPAYMSPEQCRGAGNVDRRSDIYALGCILFEMVTGQPPFVAEGMGEVFADHLRTPAPSPRTLAPNVPVELAKIILRCLEKDPAARFQTMTQVADELSAQASNGPFAARPATPHSFAMPDEETEVDPGLALRLMAQGWGEESSTASGHGEILAPPRKRKVSTLDSAASESVQTMPWAAKRHRFGVWLVGAGALAASAIGIVSIARRGPHAMRTVSELGPHAAASATIVTPPIVVTPLGLRVRLSVDSHPRGAAVWRDHVNVGRTPFTEEMTPTSREIVYTLKLSGYDDGEARFDGGGEQTIDLVRKHVAAVADSNHALDALHTRFQAVSAEYESFAHNHGTALAQQWSAVSAKMTANPRDHIAEIMELLESLHRDMTRLR